MLFGLFKISNTGSGLFCASFFKNIVLQKTNYSLFLEASLLPESNIKI